MRISVLHRYFPVVTPCHPSQLVSIDCLQFNYLLDTSLLRILIFLRLLSLLVQGLCGELLCEQVIIYSFCCGCGRCPVPLIGKGFLLDVSEYWEELKYRLTFEVTHDKGML